MQASIYNQGIGWYCNPYLPAVNSVSCLSILVYLNYKSRASPYIIKGVDGLLQQYKSVPGITFYNCIQRIHIDSIYIICLLFLFLLMAFNWLVTLCCIQLRSLLLFSLLNAIVSTGTPAFGFLDFKSLSIFFSSIVQWSCLSNISTVVQVFKTGEAHVWNKTLKLLGRKYLAI